MPVNLDDVIAHFSIKTSCHSYGNGHINDTYLIEKKPGYILQRINKNVFEHPEQVMENILAVTEHIKCKLVECGGDPERETLTVISALDGKPYYKADEDNYFRVYKFIENAVCYDEAENPEQLYNAAKAFGKFQKMLSDFPAEKLHETIPQFHNTKKRFADLKEAIKLDKAGRKDSVIPEIDFALAREKDTTIVYDSLLDGSIPMRVTHNDTKLNNVMLDKKTGNGVCVIDLDTVMPGSLLYDYGDALRFAASTAAEDETDLSKITIDLNSFEMFTKGFVEELGDALTKKEAELMAFSVKLLTFECGMRFLTDYLGGDTYFKIHRQNHNLYRARAQFKLVSEIEKKLPEMNEIVKKYFSF